MSCNDDPNRRFIHMFASFFDNGHMAATYKAVFLRALADLGKYGQCDMVGTEWIRPDGDKLHLDLNFVAARLAKYYWDMEVSFKMRHTPKRMVDCNHPDADITIIKLIHREEKRIKERHTTPRMDMLHHSETGADCKNTDTTNAFKRRPPTLEEMSSPNMADFRKEVINRVIKEVLKKLSNDMPNLYTTNRDGNHIILDRHIIKFMKSHATIIKKALNYRLALHLESINPEARHIATKIDAEMDICSRTDKVGKLEARIDHKHKDVVCLEEPSPHVKSCRS